MTKSKRRHPERDFTPTHPNAAAIDIGSRMHVVFRVWTPRWMQGFSSGSRMWSGAFVCPAS